MQLMGFDSTIQNKKNEQNNNSIKQIYLNGIDKHAKRKGSLAPLMHSKTLKNNQFESSFNMNPK